jgi:hypothetical protein
MERPRQRRKKPLEFPSCDCEDIHAGAALSLVGLAHHSHDIVRRRRPEICRDQGRFQFVQGTARQFGGTGDNSFDFVNELLVRLLQPGFEFVEQTHGDSGE